MRLILPKMHVENSGIIYPFFFLAGPDLGGGDWREVCLLKLARQLSHFFAVVPCRWPNSHRFFIHRVLDAPIDETSRQTDWEWKYLFTANTLSVEHQGCIIFWLPCENSANPRNDGQPFARDTYGEIGRWSRDAAVRNAHIVVGAKEGFPGLSQIKRNLELDFKNGKPFHMHSTLDETVADAVAWVDHRAF